MSFQTNRLGQPVSYLRNDSVVLTIFSTTLFVSAFLLFSIQPFFTKMVLPRLGGSPGVWSVAMVFFQAMLLGGYVYAHLLSRYLTPKIAALVHLAIMVAALIFLPIAIPSGWNVPPDQGQSIWLLGLFSASVGLPFFAVAANGPLLQNWFAKSGHPHSEDPYFLYGASNLGSFASLFLFIALIEPSLTVPEISKAWMVGFIALGALIIICAITTVRAYSVSGVSDTKTQSLPSLPIGKLQIAKWIGLSFVPSGLLVAVTAHISTDIAAAPFLWVIPLALFLVTFIFAFAQKRIFSVNLLATATTILAIAVLCSIRLGGYFPVTVSIFLHPAFFFSAALLCHSVLVDLRPTTDKLTSFYMWMSFGGVLGGIFASLLAPVIFNSIAEYPILVILVLFCRPATWRGNNRVLITASCAAAIIAAISTSTPFATVVLANYRFFYLIGLCVFALVSLRYLLRDQAWFIFQVIVFFALAVGMGNMNKTFFTERSFFGVVKAYESDDRRFILLAHGSTLHGAMAKDANGQKPEPLTYYHRTGGIANSLFAAQQKWALSPLGRNANIGVVGLGTGSMFCHRKPNENWTYFEIDKAVVSAASDPSIFQFVHDCGQNDPIVLGDARLKLLDQPDRKFDYLLVDAFSSDAIPVHLMTVEAFKMYFSKMTDDGILVIHISNRYAELASVIQAVAKTNGYTGRFGSFNFDNSKISDYIIPSNVVVLAKTEAALGRIADDPKWKALPDRGTKPWTDDRSDLLGAILRGQDVNSSKKP